MSAVAAVVVVCSAAARGERLDLFLATAARDGMPGLAGLSRARLQALIAAGAVAVDAAPARAGARLRGGETLRVSVPPPRPLGLVPTPMALEVLYEDAELVVVNKPAGLVVHPGAGVRSPTLVEALLAHCGDLAGIGGVLRPGIVHRLDRGTSGAIVVAKTDHAHQAIAAQFAARTVAKAYVALCVGRPQPAAGRIDTPYGRHPGCRRRFSGRATAVGRPRRAVTDYVVRATVGRASLLAVRLHTGRTHQIRVHLAERGHPLWGDVLYGGSRDARLAGAPQLEHQALHAARLRLRHPSGGRDLVVTAPWPRAFCQAAQALGLPPCAVAIGDAS